MSDFDHFLLTRFSAVLAPGAPPASEDWLYYRLGFFVDAAHPSVVAQRDAAFTWLVLFDDRCSDAFRSDVEMLAADGSFIPMWSHHPFRRDTFADAVAARSATPHLITTRMDSDDAIAADYLAAVQAQFAHQERLFVSFTRGLQLDRSGAVYRCDQLSNPFLSLIERRAPGTRPLTVYGPKHARARSLGPLREVAAPPMWAQVVHDANVSNIITGTRTDPRVVADRFVLGLGYRRNVPFPRLLVEKAVHRVRLARLWTAHPGELTRHVEARFWRLRGTHTCPQDPAARTLSDTLRARRPAWLARSR
ncbi:MAG: hypothetical protein EOL91_06360 [Actinobacteria bacterium]|nr:hypothetical protein [Actinomycetota bacterium]